MKKISIIIVAKDNPPYLSKTINSVKEIADELIIVDIGIGEKTKNLIKEYKIIRLIKIEEEIEYVEIIREKIKAYSRNKYIFFLDPDEVVPEELIKVIKEKVDLYDYFAIPRKNIIFKKWIKNARWWPDYQIRLFKKDKVIWPNKIHQQPKTQGKGYTVKNDEKLAIIHYNYENLDDYLQKMIRYAKVEAEEMKKNKEDWSLNKAIEKALSEFISRFFTFDGYKEGMRGFVLSFLQMFYYFLVYFYFWEEKKYDEVNQKSIIYNVKHFFLNGLYSTNFWLIKKNLLNRVDKIKTKIINKIILINESSQQ